MAELKTKATTASVSDFLAGIEDEERRMDCKAVSKLMQKATGAKPRMWGPSIVGFGMHTTGKGCLYIKRLANVDLDVLKTLIEDSVKESKSR